MPASDELIRHLRFKSQCKNNKIHKRAFKPDRDDVGHGLSTTACGDRILSEANVDAYQAKVCQIEAGMLGLCYLKIEQVEHIGVAIVVDAHDEHEYGDLHRLLQDHESEDKCPTEDKRDQLAYAATLNGNIRVPDAEEQQTGSSSPTTRPALDPE